MTSSAAARGKSPDWAALANMLLAPASRAVLNRALNAWRGPAMNSERSCSTASSAPPANFIKVAALPVPTGIRARLIFEATDDDEQSGQSAAVSRRPVGSRSTARRLGLRSALTP